MTLKEHLRKNILLATPVVIGQLGHIMVGVADSVMIGRVGVVPLAGATFANSIFYVLFLFGIGVSNALTPLVSSTNPENKSRLYTLLQNNILLNLSLGIGIFLIAFTASFFLDYFGQEKEVVDAARPYLRIICSSIIPVMVFQSFRQYSEGLSDTFIPMVVSVIGNLINVGLNYFLIYGKFGFPALGLNGAGLATMISRIIMLGLVIYLTRRMWMGMVMKFTKSIIRQQFNLGIPLGFQYVFEVGTFATASIMIGWIGAEELAAHQIAINMAAVTYMAASGVATAASVRVGNQLGRKDQRNLRIAGFSSFGIVGVFMAFCGLLFILLKDWLPLLYIEDKEVTSIASSLLVIGAAFQISDGLQAVGLGVLRGLRDVKIPTAVTFVSYWIIAIPLAYLFGFSFNWGIQGVWYALLSGLSLAAILHIWRFNRLSKTIKF
ncbi:MAG: MATE family efflux transporter [Ekhidna sp.]|nr:MATE family efflux transporter [Ekhidna sp.]